MRFFVFVATAAAVAVAGGCGRLGFDSGENGPVDAADAPAGDGDGGDAAVTGHDEDGDGVPDAVDNCPHLVGSQADADGDGVGDACDPAPAVAGERIALFATLAPTDQPLTLGGSGTWTPGADGLAFVGGYGTLRYAVPLATARIAFGMDIVGLVTGMGQNQIALGTSDGTDSYFVQIQASAGVERATVTHTQGGTFTDLAIQPLTSGVSLGPLTLQHTMTVGSPPVVRFDGGWPGDPYQLTADAPLYTGATAFQLGINNIELTVRYVVVITSM